MPAPFVSNPSIGPRILARLRAKHPDFTVRRIAHELGCSIGHVSSLLNGTVVLGIDACLGLAERANDPDVIFAPELASLNRTLVAQAEEGSEEFEVETNATSDAPERYRIGATIARCLDVSDEGGGASLSDGDVQVLLRHRERILDLMYRVDGALGGRDIRVAK